MAEYTKIETAMEIICCLCNDLYPNSVCPGECNWMGYLRENAADVAPVVRCVDCLFFRSGENECESWEWCELHGIDMSANAFCSYGNRMDSDEQ